MYQFSYAEIVEDCPTDARQREREAFDHAVGLLKVAEEKGPNTREAVNALHFTRQLWTILIDDLSQPENDRPEKLRADLISIGLWVMREADEIRLGRSQNFAGIGEVCTIIRDGLK